MINDMRDFIKQLDKRGLVKHVEGADPDLEIGTITELVCERKGPALVFDKLKGYPRSYRIAVNLIQNQVLGQKLAYGIPEELGALESIQWFKDKMMAFKPVPTKEVKDGPVMENVITGKDIDIHQFPAPRWRERDGGRYLGTGVIQMHKDPDSDWVNVGTYRVMVQEDDNKVVSNYISNGKQGDLIRKKYWTKGKPCPLVMCFGQDILTFAVSASTYSPGVSELEVAGYFKGRPIEVIKGPVTGLPIPSSAEIAIEGYVPPPSEDSRVEGPLGEWTGYYGSGASPEPVMHIQAIYHRNDPILLGQPPVRPPVPYAMPIALDTAALLWERLERVGIPGIKGVYGHGPSGKVIMVVSIKQSYFGHAKEVATLCAPLMHGNLASKYIIVVDEDIDPSNIEEVLWAVSTRCAPENQIDIREGYLTSRLDPSLPMERRERKEWTASRVFVEAVKPFWRYDSFPAISQCTDEQRTAALKKWGHLFEF
jgi:UbiD family decarboxylase